MNAVPPRNDALDVLRALFDLADADVHPDVRLLGRLTRHEPTRLADLLHWLRTRGLLQRDTLCLTMSGLLVATALPPFELLPMAERPRRPPDALRAA